MTYFHQDYHTERWHGEHNFEISATKRTKSTKEHVYENSAVVDVSWNMLDLSTKRVIVDMILLVAIVV